MDENAFKEITTHIGPYDTYSITIMNGKIIRVTCIMSGSAFCHVLESELDSLSNRITTIGKSKFMIWNGAKCQLHTYSDDDFKALIEDAITQTAYHNITRFQDLYYALSPGMERDYCRKVQKHILELLDF